MAVNYTQEEVAVMIDRYVANPSRDTVEELAVELNKSIKSIIGKLSREGVYQKAIYKTKTGELPITKAELIVQLADVMDSDSTKLMGLEKAPKQDLKYLLEEVRGLCE
jgi:ribosomal protein L10